jgi:hypothetical protein
MDGGWKIDPATVTRGVTYLYRWWLQEQTGVVAEAYIRRQAEATLPIFPR